MKEIIYLDTGFLHSYIAQTNDGLPTASSMESGEELKNSHEQHSGYDSKSFIEGVFKTGSFEIPLVFKTPEGEMSARIQPGKFSNEKTAITQTETGKEIITKNLHDNALNNFEEHLQQSKLITEDITTVYEGDYLKVSSTFNIMDFNYLKKIIQPETLIELIHGNNEDTIKRLETEFSLIKDQKEKATKKVYLAQMKSEFNKQKAAEKNKFEYAHKAISYLDDILPNSSFIMMDKLVAPLKPKFLRENANELMFKYGKTSSDFKITLVGKVTRKIRSLEMPDDDIFKMDQILYAMLGSLGLMKLNDLIISPIAIYFE